jgi:hypothetical protein
MDIILRFQLHISENQKSDNSWRTGNPNVIIRKRNSSSAQLIIGYIIRLKTDKSQLSFENLYCFQS